MKFFISHAKDDEHAEKVLTSIAQFINAAIPKKRIYKISYTHNGKNMIAEVGKPADSYYREGKQPVIAILKKTNCYCVCLPNRGVLGGEPILVGDDSFSTHVEYFE